LSETLEKVIARELVSSVVREQIEADEKALAEAENELAQIEGRIEINKPVLWESNVLRQAGYSFVEEIKDCLPDPSSLAKNHPQFASLIKDIVARAADRSPYSPKRIPEIPEEVKTDIDRKDALVKEIKSLRNRIDYAKELVGQIDKGWSLAQAKKNEEVIRHRSTTTCVA
jgi:hypothetical protein